MVNLEMINDLWLQIDTLHLSYLHTEESPQRIDQKRKLKGFMKEYLCSVTANQRFYSPTTKAILYTSILKHGEQLSPSRFRHAWEMLATYAANLLGQPWRKEFNEIRLYSGAFKYQIEQQLVGAEEILMEMGYTLDIEFNRLMIQGLIDYDQVVIIHRDCLLAEVESQILCEVHSALSSSPRPCTWVSIFDFRDSYVGSVNHCVRGLMFLNAQKDTVMAYGYPNTTPSTYLGPHEMYPNPFPYQVMYQQYVKPACNPYSISTDQRETYLPKTLPVEDYTAKYYPARPQDSRSMEKQTQEPFDVWNNTLVREMKSIPKFDSLLDIDRLEQLCYADVVDSCPPKGVADKQKENKTQPLKEENSDCSGFDRGLEKKVLGPSNKLSSGPSTLGSKPKEVNATRSANELNSLSAKFNGWECLFCTFLNPDDKEICDMCSKSRHRGPESQPLHRGGRECSHCTLVNPPDEQNCAACSTSLTHAPTYI